MQPSEIRVGQLLECRGREVQCVTDASSAGVSDADSDAVAFVACVGLLVADGVLVRVSVGAGVSLEGTYSESSNVVAVAVVSSAGVQASAVEGSVTSVRLSTAAVAAVIVVVSGRLGLLSRGGSAMSSVMRRGWVGLLGGGSWVGLFGSGGSRFMGQNAGGRDGSARQGSGLGGAATSLGGATLCVVRGRVSLDATSNVLVMMGDSSRTALGSECTQNEGWGSEKSDDGNFHSGLLLAMNVLMWASGQMRALGWK